MPRRNEPSDDPISFNELDVAQTLLVFPCRQELEVEAIDLLSNAFRPCPPSCRAPRPSFNIPSSSSSPHPNSHPPFVPSSSYPPSLVGPSCPPPLISSWSSRRRRSVLDIDLSSFPSSTSTPSRPLVSCKEDSQPACHLVLNAQVPCPHVGLQCSSGNSETKFNMPYTSTVTKANDKGEGKGKGKGKELCLGEVSKTFSDKENMKKKLKEAEEEWELRYQQLMPRELKEKLEIEYEKLKMEHEESKARREQVIAEEVVVLDMDLDLHL